MRNPQFEGLPGIRAIGVPRKLLVVSWSVFLLDSNCSLQSKLAGGFANCASKMQADSKMRLKFACGMFRAFTEVRII